MTYLDSVVWLLLLLSWLEMDWFFLVMLWKRMFSLYQYYVHVAFHVIVSNSLLDNDWSSSEVEAIDQYLLFVQMFHRFEKDLQNVVSLARLTKMETLSDFVQNLMRNIVCAMMYLIWLNHTKQLYLNEMPNVEVVHYNPNQQLNQHKYLPWNYHLREEEKNTK